MRNARIHIIRLLAIPAIAACTFAALSACGGGGGSATPTGQVGGAEVTPRATVASPSAGAATTVASPSAAASPVGTSTTAAGALTIVAPEDETFDKNELVAPASTQVTVTFVNNTDLQHDWHLFNGGDASAPTITRTNIITGPQAHDSVTFVTPTEPGRYFFHCDVHPTVMTGFLVVE